MSPSHPNSSQNQCRYDGCPYSADFGIIKTKLDVMDDKLDRMSNDLRTADERLRYLETAQARINGIASQAKWDTRTIVMMAMFVLSFVGVILTVVKDFTL